MNTINNTSDIYKKLSEFEISLENIEHTINLLLIHLK